MWMIIGLVAALSIVGAGLLLAANSIVGSAPAPLQLLSLHPATQSISEASLEGTWIAGDGSVAGFRVPESFLIQHGTIVGRTSAVTGSLLISHQEISSASFQVDLSKIIVPVGGKPNASFFQLLETSTYSDATLTLARPIVFSAIPTNGQTLSSPATALLSMRGVTHPVTLTIKARSNGSVLEAAGSAPVRVSEWGIQSPFAVQNDALIEFLVVLHRGIIAKSTALAWWRDGWFDGRVAPGRTADVFCEQVRAAVTRSRQRGRVAIVIADNLRTHTPAGSLLVRSMLIELQEHVRLVYTPAYDPDSNRIEWRCAHLATDRDT